MEIVDRAVREAAERHCIKINPHSQLQMGQAYLQWQHHQGNTNENDHQQLGGPDLGRDIAVANRGEGDDAEVKGVKQGKLFSSSFQMLDPTSSEELF